MRVDFSMLNPNNCDEITVEAEQESKRKSDIAFTHLAMPSLSLYYAIEKKLMNKILSISENYKFKIT